MKLSFHTADGSFRAADLTKVKTSVVIGRDRQLAQLVIPDTQVSRSHTVLTREDDGFYAEDLGSRNGTWLNGVRIRKARLKTGDVLKIGSTDLKVTSEAESGPEDSLLGRNLDGFELHEVLGRGSYGTVYKGMQTALGRPVAVKVLDHRHQKKKEQIDAFLEEARRAGRLNHPNVVQVHDVRQIDKQFMLVMELMTGGSMADRLRIDGPQGAEVILGILEDMGHALAYAESQRLVHRDVKPDNILVNAEGVYKLADLGIAAPISDDGQAHQVRTFGSAHYVAPEQAKGGAIDGRADIYALGASMWHLATGQPMFDGTARQIVAAHIGQEPPDLKALAPGLSPNLVDLIYQLVEKDPANRPSTGLQVSELASEVRAGGSDSFGRIGSSELGRPARRRRRVRRRRR